MDFRIAYAAVGSFKQNGYFTGFEIQLAQLGAGCICRYVLIVTKVTDIGIPVGVFVSASLDKDYFRTLVELGGKIFECIVNN